MSIILKNNTGNNIEVLDLGITIDANSQLDITHKSTDSIRRSDNLISLLIEGNITFSDGLLDYIGPDAVRVILGNSVKIQSTTYHDGRLSVQVTPRQTGLMTYFSGEDDDQTDQTKIGGSNKFIYVNFIASENNLSDPCFTFIPDGSSTPLTYYHIGPLYYKFNSIINKTTIHDAIITWKDCDLPVFVSVSIVPEISTIITDQINTNFNLYNNYLIVPAAGNGTIGVTTQKLVQVTPNQFGDKPQAFWNANFNSTTKEFENLTPAPYGNGEFNMFSQEVNLLKFVRKWPLLGSNTMKLFTADSETMGHNLMFKFTLRTTGTHNWQFSTLMHMFREKTC